MKTVLVVLTVLVATMGALIIVLNTVEISTINNQETQVQHLSHEVQQHEREIDRLEQKAHIHL